jgi:membrane protease YdiL (CAAX protease family)
MLEERAPAPLIDDAPRPHAAGWGWREIGATLVLVVAATLALSLVARGLVAAFGLEAGDSLVSPALYLVGVGIYLAAVAGVYLFAARRAGWGALGLRGAPWPNFALVGPLFIVEVLALAAVNSLVGLLAGGFENPQVDAITGGQPIGPTELAMLLLLVAGLVPFAEELFFRGMVYPVMRRRFGAPAAIALNAAFFSLAHVIPVLLPGLFVVGLLLAYLRERSGSIWPSVCLHALQNSLAMISIAVALSSGAI